MKFGGTSVQDARRVRGAASIVAGRASEPVLVVVSAAAGVTRWLLDLGAAAADMQDNAAGELFGALRRRQFAILEELGVDFGVREATRQRLARLFEQLSTLVDAIEADGRYDARRQDAVISLGERFSSALFHAAAQSALSAEAIDATRVVVTDDRFRAARPDAAHTGRRARQIIAPVLEGGSVVVTEGFVGATMAGETTTMGFEASDLSASLFGAALGAREVQIWTDVPGMLTAVHLAIEAPRVVAQLTFDEAAELALFGAKVLHPDSIAPARDADIPVRILSSGQPEAPGTLIDRHGGGRSGAPTARAIALIEDAEDDSFAAARETLRDAFPEGLSGCAIVCPVGEGIGYDQAFRSRLREIVGTADAFIAPPPRPHSVPIAVPRRRLSEVVRLLHADLLDI